MRQGTQRWAATVEFAPPAGERAAGDLEEGAPHNPEPVRTPKARQTTQRRRNKGNLSQ